MKIGKGISTLNGVVRSFGNIMVRGGRMRKRGGEVFSYAPHVAELLGGASRAAMGVLLVGGAFAISPAASAQSLDCDNLTCTSPVVIDLGAGGTIDTSANFDLITSDTSPALTINSTGSATFIDANNSEITNTGANAAGILINAEHSVTVTASTNITAKGDGLRVEAQGSNGGAVVTNLSGSIIVDGSALAIAEYGNGNIWVDIAATGNLTGALNGIYTASAGTGTTNITNAGTVGGGFGVFAAGATGGKITVTNSGTINGVTSAVHAWQMGPYAGGIDIINTGTLSGGANGASAVQQTIGDVYLNTSGAGSQVTGSTYGVNFVHGNAGNIIVENEAGSLISGGQAGVYANHVWSGNIDVDNQSVITSDAGVGVELLHGGQGNVIVDNTGSIYSINSSTAAAGSGISISRDATANGAVNVTNSGTIAAVGTFNASTLATTTTGQTLSEGIGVSHAGTGLVTVNNTAAINADWAIWAKHQGTFSTAAPSSIISLTNGTGGVLNAASSALWGFATETALGDIMLTNNGTITNTNTSKIVNFAAISAAHEGTGRIAITNSGSVSATGLAIGASHNGTGEISINSTGDLVSATANAVLAANYGGGNVTVSVGNASNGAAATGYAAISTTHEGAAVTAITTNGTVSGSYSAIYAQASGGAIQITNEQDGVLKNLSGATDARAVEVADYDIGFANARLTNLGTITGTVQFGSGDDVFNNYGIWNVSGISDFGTGYNTINEYGVLNAANADFVGLDELNVYGDLNLRDGEIDSSFQTSASVSFDEDSQFIIEAGLGGADNVSTAGPVSLGGTLIVDTLGSTLGLAGETHTIINAEDGVSGEFDNDEIVTSAFMAWEVDVLDNRVDITYTQQRDLVDAALTPNQAATADGIDSLSYSNALRDTLLHVADDATAQSAFTQLSGELHPAVRTALTEDSRLTRNAVLDRLQDPAEGLVWGQLFGNWGVTDASTITNTHKLKREVTGGVLGFDLPISESMTVGLAGAYTENDFSQNALASKGKAETYHVLAYVGTQSGPLQVKVGVGYGWGDITTKRAVSFTGFSSAHAAKYDASLLQAFGEIGVRVDIGGGYIQPVASLTYVNAKTDAFAEDGGVAALIGEKESEKSMLSVIGTRFSTPAAGAFSIRGLAGWQHGYGKLTPTSSLRFNGGENFSIAGVQQSRNAGVVNVEANFALSNGSSLGFGYDGVISNQGHDHAGKLTLRVGF